MRGWTKWTKKTLAPRRNHTCPWVGNVCAHLYTIAHTHTQVRARAHTHTHTHTHALPPPVMNNYTYIYIHMHKKNKHQVPSACDERSALRPCRCLGIITLAIVCTHITICPSTDWSARVWVKEIKYVYIYIYTHTNIYIGKHTHTHTQRERDTHTILCLWSTYIHDL